MIGPPQNSWVRVALKLDDFELNFVASNIPENPVEKLAESLILLAAGDKGSTVVTWNLEPNCCHFEISAYSRDTIGLRIFESVSESMQGKEILVALGSFNEILRPFYRSVKLFESLNQSENDWVKIPKSTLNKLTAIFKDRKGS